MGLDLDFDFGLHDNYCTDFFVKLSSNADPMGLGHRRAVAAGATSGSSPGPVLLHATLRHFDLCHVVLAGLHHSELHTSACSVGAHRTPRHAAGARWPNTRPCLLLGWSDDIGSADRAGTPYIHYCDEVVHLF